MTATTLNGVLLFGTAASRPAASAVAKGTLYSATDTGAITQSDGVSTWSAWASVGSGFTNPMTTAGDIIYSSGGSTAARLAASSTNRILTSAGFSTAPYWGQGALASTGDIMLGSSTGTPTRLASGASTFVLTSLGVGVNPAWAAAGSGGGSSGAMTLITDTLLGADTATFDFTSIPGTYKHLVIMMSARSTESATNTWIKMTFNNDTGSNYDCLQAQMFAGSSSAGFNEDLAATSMAHMVYVAGDTASANYVGGATIHIPNYAATTFDKIAYSNGAMILGTSTTNIRAITAAGFWRSTSAITRITLTPTTGNFKSGSRASLYGIS